MPLSNTGKLEKEELVETGGDLEFDFCCEVWIFDPEQADG